MEKITFSFYQDDFGLWRWKKYSNKELIFFSEDGFTNLHECEKNASLNGWGVYEKIFSSKEKVFISKETAKQLKLFLMKLMGNDMLTNEEKKSIESAYEEILTLEC